MPVAWEVFIRLLLRRRRPLWLHLARTTGTASAALAAHHLVELLLLVSVEDGLDLARGRLPDLHHLGAAIVLRQRGIVAEGLHLLGFVFEDGLDLLLLRFSQVELLAHALQTLVSGRRLPLAPAPPAARPRALRRKHWGPARQHRENHVCDEYVFLH